MSAVPQYDHQHAQQPEGEAQPLAIFDAGQESGAATRTWPLSTDDALLTGMLVCCGIFGAAMFGYLVLPQLNLWLSL